MTILTYMKKMRVIEQRMKSQPLVEKASLTEIRARAKNKAKKVTTKINANQMWDQKETVRN